MTSFRIIRYKVELKVKQKIIILKKKILENKEMKIGMKIELKIKKERSLIKINLKIKN